MFFFETTKLEPDWLFSDKKNFFPARFAAIPDFRLKLTEYEQLQDRAMRDAQLDAVTDMFGGN